jgi:16S rRNA (guanine(966)-N(2))-methyltransferase RsmD
MRITGGEFLNRRLLVPRGAATRPTTDKVRQALFNILGERTAGSRFLDLFAGSGAVGLEALSRGARSAVFVEGARPALEALRMNLRALEAEERGRVLPLDWRAALKRLQAEGAPFDLVFADPPYRMSSSRSGENSLFRHFPRAILRPGGLLILESFARDQEPAEEGLRLFRRAEYGQTALSFFAPDNPGPA